MIITSRGIMAWLDLKRRIKSANARITNVERVYGKDSKFVKSIYKSLESAYGVGGGEKRRFTTPADNAKLVDIAKIDRALQRIEMSAYTSKAGRDAAYKKSRESWAKENPDKDIRAFDMFIKAKEELGEMVYKTSSQIINEVDKAVGLSKKDFKEIIQQYKDDIENDVFTEMGEENPHFFEYLHDKVKELENEKMARRSKKKFFGV